MTGRPGDTAIIGMAGRFPDAPDIDSLWHRLVAGEDCVRASLTRAPLASPDQYARVGVPGIPAGFLAGFDRFDAGFFRISPLEARITDPQHRLLLETAAQALEEAGYGDPTGLRVGVFATATQNGYQWTNVRANAAVVAATDETQIALANAPDFLASRISFKLDLRGPSVTVAAACASSLVALHLARESLLAGACDLALVGAASVTASPWCGCAPGGAPIPPVSADRCRSFSADAEHTVAGDGVVAVVLRRLDDALAARDEVRAVVKGTAVTNDGGLKMGFSTPAVDGQVAAVRDALAAAGVDPATVSYVEGHGSGTPIGDSIELTALAEAYGPRPGGRLLGSIKSNIGYLDGTSGLAGVVKTVLALRHERIPANLHFTGALPGGDGFTVVTEPQPWPRTGSPRRAGVSAYAMGGTNTHVILEEAPAAPAVPGPAGTDRRYALLTVSGHTCLAADTAVERLAGHLAGTAGVGGAARPHDVGYTLHVGRRAAAWRRSLVVDTAAPAPGPAVESSGAVAAGVAGSAAVAGWSAAVAASTPPPGVAVRFPDAPPDATRAAALYRLEPAFRAAVDECSAVLRETYASTLPPFDSATDPAGPAPAGRAPAAEAVAFVVWYGLLHLLATWGLHPRAVTGHATGRAAAAVHAGSVTLAEALRPFVEPPADTDPAGGTDPAGEPGPDLVVGDAVPIDAGTCLDEYGRVRTIAQLWAAGVEIDWSGYHAGERLRRVPLPTYPFERTRYWVDPDPVYAPEPAPAGVQPAAAGTPAVSAWDDELDHLLDDEADPVGRIVAKVWQEVLGVPAVGPTDDFFALGGDSLRLLRVTGRLRELFGIEVPLANAFDARRLSQVVALLEELVTREAIG